MKMNEPRDHADQNEPPIDFDEENDYNGYYEGDFDKYDKGKLSDYERQMGY
jgi:hypothetical protein